MNCNSFFRALLCGTGFFTLLGCTMAEIEMKTNEDFIPEEDVFTLTATYGAEGTKVSFDEDGLNMSWQPGDCLYLVDVAGKNSTVKMVSSITEPSKTASFRSQSSVLSGNYVVIYGQSNRSVSNSISMTSISSLNSKIRLYGTLTVEDGQTSASISLRQLFAMLTFKFKNMPALSGMMLGMAVAQDGIPSLGSGTIQQNGITTDSYGIKVYFDWNSGAEGKSFITPVDFTGKKLYFFVYGTDADGKHVTYEFVKNGKNLCEGINYNLTFDFSQASSVCTLQKSSVNNNTNVLNSPESFRAASYWNQSTIGYSVEADVDFAEKVYFPIQTSVIYGNKHTLSNINVNFSKCSYVGVLSQGNVESLTIKNSSITGNDHVGALTGSCTYVRACSADSVTINGKNYVGGLAGFTSSDASSPISNCSLLGTSTVTGDGAYVGGIVGRSESSKSIAICLVKGTVLIKGSNYTGGIVGYSASPISNCGFEGTVIGAKYTGGISGYSTKTIQKSYTNGNVSGGIELDTYGYVGGITGYSSGGSTTANDVLDSYHIGNTTGRGDYIGGICGGGSYIKNCYSYGTTSSGFGISYYLNYSGYNLTSSSKTSISNSIARYCSCGPDKTFLSLLSVINGNEAYSTQVWKDNDAQCPLLQWQADALNGEIDIPGFGNEEW